MGHFSKIFHGFGAHPKIRRWHWSRLCLELGIPKPSPTRYLPDSRIRLRPYCSNTGSCYLQLATGKQRIQRSPGALKAPRHGGVNPRETIVNKQYEADP
jgi:hypothetical protein